MRRLGLSIVLVSLTASVASAQGRMPGGMGGPPGGMGGQRPPSIPKFPSTKDLEKFNAALPLIDQRRKLKLTDSTAAALTALRATLYERNADLLVRYDSVRRDFKPPRMPSGMGGGPPGGMGGGSPGGMGGGGGSMPSQEEMQKLGEQIRLMSDIGEQLLARRPADVQACLELIDTTQRERAEKLLADQTKELREQFPRMPDEQRRRD